MGYFLCRAHSKKLFLNFKPNPTILLKPAQVSHEVAVAHPKGRPSRMPLFAQLPHCVGNAPAPVGHSVIFCLKGSFLRRPGSGF